MPNTESESVDFHYKEIKEDIKEVIQKIIEVIKIIEEDKK